MERPVSPIWGNTQPPYPGVVHAAYDRPNPLFSNTDPRRVEEPPSLFAGLGGTTPVSPSPQRSVSPQPTQVYAQAQNPYIQNHPAYDPRYYPGLVVPVNPISPPTPKKTITEQIPGPVLKALDDVEATFLLTKQLVLEKLGKVQATIDSNVAPKVEKLWRIYAEFEQLVIHSYRYYVNFKDYRESHKHLSMFFSEAASKEMIPILADQMYEVAQLHHLLYEQGHPLFTTVQKLHETALTFRKAAIEDTMCTCDKYENARVLYDVAKNRLTAAEKSGDPVKIKKAEDIINEKKEEYSQLGVDLTTKMILLNEKRIQILSEQLRNYHKALRQYYAQCSTLLLSKTPIDPKEFDVTTDDFKEILGEKLEAPTTTNTLEKTPEENEKSLLERLSSQDM